MADLQLDNKQCILVEFVNEESSIAVGFRNWIKHKASDDELTKIIKNNELIEIRWPKCDVLEARKMKKLLKTLSASDWEQIAVKLIGFGEWTEMQQKLHTLEKFDKPQLSRNERAGYLLKKCVGENDNVTKKFTIKGKKLPKAVAKTEAMRKRSQNILRKINNESDSESERVSSEDVEPIAKQSRMMSENDIRILKLEIINLKKENDQLKNETHNIISAMRASEELPKIDEKIRGIHCKLDEIAAIVSSKGLVDDFTQLIQDKYITPEELNIGTKKSQKHTIDSSFVGNCIIRNKNHETAEPGTSGNNFQAPDVPEYASENIWCKVLAENKANAVSRQTIADSIIIIDDSLVTDNHRKKPDQLESEMEIDSEKEYKDFSRKVFESDTHVSNSNDKSTKQKDTAELSQEEERTESNPQHENHENKPQEDMLDLGNGIKLPQLVVDKIPHEQQSILIRRLLCSLFTDEELANSTRTGRKNKENDKGRLDKKRLDAIEHYVKKNFGTKFDNAKFKNTITCKCKDVARAFNKNSTSKTEKNV